jgi:hypothetical protein
MVAGVAEAQTNVTTATGGTTNQVPKMSGSSTIVDSAITESGGNVGIGITQPSTALNAAGLIKAQLGNGMPYYAGVTIGATTFGAPFVDFHVDDDSSRMQLKFGGVNTDQERLGFWGDCDGSCTDTERMSILSNGNVGIGTTIPYQWGTNSNFNFDGTNVQVFAVWGSSRLVLNSATEDAELHLISGNAAQNHRNHRFYVDQNGLTLDQPVDDYSSSTVNMFWSNDGKVGIGTDTPGQALDIAGNIQIDGTGAGIYFPGNPNPQTIPWVGTTCGQDYAESVAVSGDRTHYEPGDVLVIDPNHPKTFLKSAERYSAMVAGVYSTKPGILSTHDPKGMPDPNDVPMAMVGIVPTKVTTENGSIKIGDLLVTSSRYGYAMKGTDRGAMLGAVVGKAMGPLDAGTGVIEVLVTLQ